MAAKITTIVSDVIGHQQRHHPQNISHLAEKIKGFPLKVKSFRNTATKQKLLSSTPPSPVARWGYERPWVKLMGVMLDIPCQYKHYCVVLLCEVYYVIV